ncbi:alpha/beta hydrolase [Frigidibacter sp. ROC022]|uniref:alpha/beta hydrolase n=1 Tax=Frigidibacter sp. ROC022 TaxID=2971796 RepID=UPI00215AE16A|nr:lysophospholipase [Frigidibacter sp. ROC022]MCR8723052.1 lysophospholipase [Frigidibacter sp. ROC022]
MLTALAILAAGLAGLWLFGPREPVVDPGFDAGLLGEDLDAYLARAEAAVPDLRSDAAKRIIWAGAKGAQTDLALIYLHGFSADRHEISPVTERLAAQLGANLFVTRMTGHGLPGEALGAATAADWLRDAGEALAIGRRLGRRVIVVAASTGATVAAVQAASGQEADGYVFVSPNFRVRGRFAFLLDGPFARFYVPLLAGRERVWEAQNPEHAAHNTMRYPSVALVPMAAVVRVARRLDLGRVKAPLLALIDPADAVVDAGVSRRVLARWGGAMQEVAPPKVPGTDPNRHIIAGDTQSPGLTDWAVGTMAAWLAELPQ